MAFSQRQSSLLSLAICVVMVSIIYLPSLLFFSFLMLPSIFLIYYDTDREHIKAKSVGSLNVVGVAHALTYSYQKYGSLSDLRTLLGDPANWLFPLGLSLVGFLIYRTLPSIIRGWTEFWLNRKEELLKERQAFLVQQWGVKVKGTLTATIDYDFLKKHDK